MNNSDEYKRGWYDGYQAAKQSNPFNPQPFMPSPVDYKPKFHCHKCNMTWEGFAGYVCPRQDCAVQPKITATSNQEKL